MAAHERYKGAVIVVDFGTATNFDIVAENGDYDGGVIAPGANLSVEALHQAAALLPRVAVHRAQNVIGNDTVPAMQSGLYWGYVGLIEGLIDAHQGGIWQADDGGGHRRAGASLPSPDIPAIEHLDPDLTIRGLMLIHARNAESRPDGARATNWSSCRWAASGEIGMNFNAYGFGPRASTANGSWSIAAYCSGARPMHPGVDIIMPDIRFLAEQRENVLGIVATHAHEDHIGAIAPLWPHAEMPDLCHALHRPADRRQAGRKRASTARACKHRAAGRHRSRWGPSRSISSPSPIPSWKPNLLAIRTPLGVDRPYRRLEARSRSAAGRGDRRGRDPEAGR